MSYKYPSLLEMRTDLCRIGQMIKDNGLPENLGPLVFTFTGDGNVSQGAKHIFDCLPVEWVKPSQLEALCFSKSKPHIPVNISSIS